MTTHKEAMREKITDNTFESAQSVAMAFHETYERLAPEYGYKTREESAVDWDSVPLNNKRLMLAVGEIILAAHTAALDKAVQEAKIKETATWREVIEVSLEGYKKHGIRSTDIPSSGLLQAIDDRLANLKKGK